MKKLRFVSLVVLSLSVILWTGGRIFFPLPDWAVRVDGVGLLCALPVAAFAAVRGRMDR